MDLDLWHSSASIGTGSEAKYGWEFDFDFCYVPDILEENAINEKSCIEVLKRLIAKADAEILDLEDDLAILQSQLSWAEHAENEKLYEVYCAAFREKITSLSRSLQTLRKGYEHNADSEIHHKPVERIHDIISALPKHSFPAENKKECVILNAEIEVRETITAASASMDLSGKQDNQQTIGTENQVSDTLIKGAEVVKESKTPSPFQQDCEGKDNIEPTLVAPLRSSDVKVEFDENETLATFLSSQGSKRNKKQSNPARCMSAGVEKKKQKKLCKNDKSGATCSSKPSKASEGSRIKFGLAVNASENSSMSSGPASYSGSKLAVSIEIGKEGAANYSPVEKQAQKTAVSEYTRDKLEKMKRDRLVAVAKSQGLKGYGKLKKSLVVDMIVQKLG